MEAPYDFADREWTDRKDVLQSAMSATCKQQAIYIQNQFVTEIIVDEIAARILHKEVLIGLWYGMCLRNASDDLQTIVYLTTFTDRHQSVIWYHWPFCRDAMQITSLREIFPADGLWRDNDLGCLVNVHEVTQATCMVTMTMGDKHVVNSAEVNAQSLCIAYKHVACPCIKQDFIPFHF